MLQKISNIVLETGKYIQAEFTTFDKKDIDSKALNQLVSYVDITAEKMLVKALHKLLPEAKFITEEQTQDFGIERIETNKWTMDMVETAWIIDPLDGTTNFMQGIPFYSISVALQQAGGVKYGVVLDIEHNNLFAAEKGKGAFLNGGKIRVAEPKSLKNGLVSTGFPYHKFDIMDPYLAVLKKLMTNTRGLRRMGSAAIDLCYTAKGTFTCFFEHGLSPWDVAAGLLIAEESGAVIRNFRGEKGPINGQQIIVACPDVDKEITQIITQNFKSQAL